MMWYKKLRYYTVNWWYGLLYDGDGTYKEILPVFLYRLKVFFYRTRYKIFKYLFKDYYFYKTHFEAVIYNLEIQRRGGIYYPDHHKLNKIYGCPWIVPNDDTKIITGIISPKFYNVFDTVKDEDKIYIE